MTWSSAVTVRSKQEQEDLSDPLGSSFKARIWAVVGEKEGKKDAL